MQIRKSIKRVFHRSSNSSSQSSDSSLSKSQATSAYPAHLFYQPGEKMPTPKYRRPVAKEHKERLEAFNFATAWKRKSQTSLYSPMGSRMPSRRNSHNFTRTPRRSFSEMRMDANVNEGSDDEGDVSNGLSRRHSRDYPNHSTSDMASTVPDSRDQSDAAMSSGHSQSFTAEDLTLAIKNSNMAVSR
ncbi:hypothetical protein EJ05DRAFT_517258 [Pseudovirgaria hyperparasitica]|uniref:Uncharacterized protein n=1 Tax=Pseudovirgaria hyperparasitica TaxID=470096 RepID=A0A6A6W4K5_9PEZI|nr:uncharacterized protein EJ05DRAFT_517258 [Pseudovirgaria hyperparasitica]KAF2756896.1 hypothetical protein EJ05DRAFT_517258 [Pseudovirgaria hyperparasitica]